MADVWGSVPAWISSIFTSASVLIAAIAYRTSVSDKEREQASKVTVWSSRSLLPPAAGIQVEPKYKDVTVTAKNASEVAIRNAQAVLEISGKEVKGGTNKLAWVRARQNWNLGDLGPTQVETATFSGVIAVAVIELTFVDGAGRSWHRDGYGKLTKMSSGLRGSTGIVKFSPVRVVRNLKYLLSKKWHAIRVGGELP